MTVLSDNPAASLVGKRMTAREFAALGNHDGLELVDGVVVEEPMALDEAWIAGRILVVISFYLESRPVAWAFPKETVLRCFEGENFRKADVSLVLKERLPELPSDRDLELAPDLAVEVISPNNTHGEITRKVQQYLRAGTRIVWVVEPADRLVRSYRPNAPYPTVLLGDDLIDGGDVLPGFSRKVSEFFPPKPSAS
jgi:Uma2 family endonuclease